MSGVPVLATPDLPQQVRSCWRVGRLSDAGLVRLGGLVM